MTSSLVVYSIVKWASCSTNRNKSISTSCFFMGNNLMSWFSKKQKLCLLLNEVEYITTRGSCSQLIWRNQMLKLSNIELIRAWWPYVLITWVLSTINITKKIVQYIVGQSTSTYDITLFELLLNAVLIL